MREETQQESPRHKHGARVQHRTVASGNRRPTTAAITTGSSTAAGRPRWPLREGARLLARPPCAAHRVLSTRGSMHTAFDTGTKRLFALPPTSHAGIARRDLPPQPRVQKHSCRLKRLALTVHMEVVRLRLACDSPSSRVLRAPRCAPFLTQPAPGPLTARVPCGAARLR